MTGRIRATPARWPPSCRQWATKRIFTNLRPEGTVTARTTTTWRRSYRSAMPSCAGPSAGGWIECHARSRRHLRKWAHLVALLRGLAGAALVGDRGEAGSAHHPTGYTAFGVWTWRHATLRHAKSVGQVIDSSCPQTNEVST